VIDLHCHVLAGIDDGPGTLEESVAVARDAAAGGTELLIATPHVSRHYLNDAATIAGKVAELNTRLAAEGVAVEVRAGAEIAITRAAGLEPDELRRLSLGGGPWLLLEPPFRPNVSGLDILLRDLQRRGHRIVLAHPERCPAFQRDPQMLLSLVGEGVLTSITAGSLVGRFGGDVRRFAMDLVAERVVHNVASDAHDRGARSPGIAAELDRSGLGVMSDWWTREVPAAILSGAELPPRPAVALPELGPRRRWRWSGRFTQRLGTARRT
jgi:protein-tyrosine phosphatase